MRSSLLSYFVYLFIYLYLRCRVYCCLLNKKRNHILTNEKHNRHFTPELVNFFCFRWPQTYTTSLVLLTSLTASVSHTIPLSAANCFSRLKLSVCNPSYLSPTVSWMYFDILNLRRTVPSRPQLTPAIALSVVPTVFSYTVDYLWTGGLPVLSSADCAVYRTTGHTFYT